MDLKEAKKSASTLLRSAKKSVATGRDISASFLAELKAKAARAAEKAHRFDNYFIGGSSSSSAHVAARAPGRARPAPPEDSAVGRLTALGFSVAAARHALRRCGGRVEEAGVWLYDEANADEILAAELAAREADPLMEGCVARINGLRGASHLNGQLVTLRKYDEESQRWVVVMRDGAMKAIRPRNLDPEASISERRGAESKIAASEVAVCQAGTPEKPRREALLTQVRTLVGEELDFEAMDSLGALSEEELMEVVVGLSMERAQGAVRKNPFLVRISPERQPAATFDAEVVGAAEDEYVALKRQLQQGAEQIRQQEDLQEERAVALEAREAALLESQARWRSEAKAEAEQIHRLEEREEELRAREMAAALPPQTPAGDGCAASAEPALDDATRRKEDLSLEERRVELEELQAKALAAARELELRQEESRRNAEERELRLLEAEEEHLRIGSLLRDEQARLEQERRKVLLLQRSLLVTASSAPRMPVADADGGSIDATAPRNFAIDDGDDDVAPGGSNAVQGAVVGASALGASDVENAEDGYEECADSNDDDDGEEVWDLDWSTLSCPVTSESAPSAAVGVGSSLAEPQEQMHSDGISQADAQLAAEQPSTSTTPDEAAMRFGPPARPAANVAAPVGEGDPSCSATVEDVSSLDVG